jgi:pimeloyl-ACP methyl ester carboxylesterase
MKSIMRGFLVTIALAPVAALAQYSGVPPGGPPTKTTFVRLSNTANAILVEPVTPDPARSRIAILVTHPEHINNFDYFVGLELPKYGYRAMLMNYYGPEESYYEFIQPIAAAIKALRALPGVEKVILAGHSSGGPELTSYQDVAENGPKACQDAERIYKCDAKGLDNLPKADGVVMIDPNVGAPEKTIALNPAVDPHHPRVNNADLDMYNPKNGFNPATRSAAYGADFLNKFFAAQRTRANQMIDEAVDRLAKIEKGEGEFKDDEPFLVAGAGVFATGSRPDGADVRLLSTSRAPHKLLKPDGTAPVQIIHSIASPNASAAQNDTLNHTTMNTTVRHYLSFQALRVTREYRETEDDMPGVKWRSTANSLEGNVEGVRVPTLFVTASCARSVVFIEIAYGRSAAKDKEMVGPDLLSSQFPD